MEETPQGVTAHDARDRRAGEAFRAEQDMGGDSDTALGTRKASRASCGVRAKDSRWRGGARGEG